ncbi:MAG: GIY-YIG nuclease family protein [Alphaproteobacteria bacterium]
MTGSFFVYILASAKHGTLYVGMTNDLMRRAFEHREGLIAGFTKTYGVKRLVYYEECAGAPAAYARERRIKKYKREWKINLIERLNPEWIDLYPGLSK